MVWKLFNAPWPEEGEFPAPVLERASERVHRYWLTRMWPFVLGQVIIALEAYLENFPHARAYLIPVALLGTAYALGLFRRIALFWLVSMSVLFVIQGMLFGGMGGITALSLTLPYTLAAVLLPGRKRVFVQACCVVGFWLSLLIDVFLRNGLLVDVKPFAFIITSYNVLMATLTFQGLRFLNRLAIELNTAYVTQEVTQQVTARSNQFLARVSHELRTPLNSVLGFAKLLRRSPLTPTQATYVAQIVEEGEQLNQLVGDLLDSAHLSSGKLTLKLEPCDLNVICRAVADETRNALKPGVALHVALSPELPSVLGDALRLCQIVRNIAGNAAKYTAQGEIAIGTSQRNGKIYITVSDTGPGIPADQLDLVFAPFVKRDNRSPGVGLGLDIARQLARLHGGDIRLESLVGAGSTFTIEMPVANSKSSSAAT
ncbi:MAG TPA: HAMP domain-containing sensor histidine kinase [Aggregatilineales bacterium]|nr:HAMP domain-containing sensor histidine kinase [Aggregatilineales bacterium]